jgi:hypothetical protein
MDEKWPWFVLFVCVALIGGSASKIVENSLESQHTLMFGLLVVQQLIWSVFILHGFYLLRRIPNPRVWTHVQWCVFGVFVAGVILRIGLANWGPGDLWMRHMTFFEEPGFSIGRYGNTGNALLSMLCVMFPRDDRIVFLVTQSLSALSPLLMVYFVEEVSKRPSVAVLSGLVLCLQPVFIRHAGEAGLQPYVLFLTLYGLWLFARFRNTRNLGDLIVGSLAFCMAMIVRPEAVMSPFVAGVFVVTLAAGRLEVLLSYIVGVLSLVISPVVVFLGPICHLLARVGSRASRGILAQTLAAFICITLFYLSWIFLIDLGGQDSEKIREVYHFFIRRHYSVPSSASSIWLDSDYTPAPFIVLVVLGFLVGMTSRDRLVAAASTALLSMALVLPVFGSPVALQLAISRYQTLPLICSSILIGTGLLWCGEWIQRIPQLQLRAIAMTVCVLGGIVSMRPALWNVTEARTIDQEYEFIKKTVGKLPADAKIYFSYYVGGGLDKGLKIPSGSSLLSSVAGYAHLWHELDENSSVPDNQPVFYYRTASCSFDLEKSSEVTFVNSHNTENKQANMLQYVRERMGAQSVLRTVCNLVTEEFRDGLLFESNLVNRHYYRDVYSSDSVPIGFYKVEQPERLREIIESIKNTIKKNTI